MGRPAEMFADPMSDAELDAHYDATALLGAVIVRPLSRAERVIAGFESHGGAAQEAPTPNRYGSGPQGRKSARPVAPTMADDGAELTGRDVLAMRAKLGRKFEGGDVTAPLHRFATDFARSYKLIGRSFPDDFMGKMRAEATRPRPLSPGQAKGILNTYCAVNRDSSPMPSAEAPTEVPASAPVSPPAAPAAPAPTATPSRYRMPTAADAGTIVLNSDDIVIKLGKSRAGRIYGKVRTPGVDGWDYAPAATRGGIRDIGPEDAELIGNARILIDDETHACVFCATPLTTDGPGESVHRGYGPTCAGKYGLPWGA